MSEPILPGRLVRDLQPTSWTLDGEGWTIVVIQSGAEFLATLYHHAKYGSHVLFVEEMGDSKEEALKALRTAAEQRKAKIENALSFDWKV